jgi:hypothetical protein
MGAMTYSGNKKVCIALLLCILVLPGIFAQNTQLAMDTVEQLLRSQMSQDIPQAEFHRVFRIFVRDRYQNRTYLYQSEIADFTSSFIVYLGTSGTLQEWTKYIKDTKPTQAQVPKFPATHRLTTESQLFAEQDTGAQVITTLRKGSTTKLEEYGDYTDMDGETAKWARVTTESGQTGWVFSGYLENVK